MVERLSLIAGSGALVPEVIAAARRRGYELQVLSHHRSGRLFEVVTVPIRLSDPQAVFESIRRFGTTLIAMAGGVHLSDLVRERVVRFFGSASASIGDASLATLSEKLAEMTGARLVGVHEIAPELLAPEGVIGGPAPDATARDSAAYALSLARRAGALDLGQAVIVAGRRAIAAEDIMGTDALLRRVQRYRTLRIVADGQSPLVIAKAVKPDQPHYVDLPAIGPITVARARKAGVRVVAVQAGAAILIERQKLKAAADMAGISVIGLPVTDA